MAGVRIDKWLWAARFFKSRSQASRACDLGRISAKARPVKAAWVVQVGDMLHIRNAGGEFEVEVLLLSEKRGPAAVAQTLYRETEESRALRLEAAEERKEALRLDPWRDGRPSKRDRRDLNRFFGKS